MDRNGRRAVSASNGKPDRGTRAAAAPRPESLRAAFDALAGDAHLRQRFGELGPAFSTVIGSPVEPFAAAMLALNPTPHSRSAARAMADVARLVGAFTGEQTRRFGDGFAPDFGSTPGERYAALASRIDDSFREFSSSPEFDRARRARRRRRPGTGSSRIAPAHGRSPGRSNHRPRACR